MPAYNAHRGAVFAIVIVIVISIILLVALAILVFAIDDYRETLEETVPPINDVVNQINSVIDTINTVGPEVGQFLGEYTDLCEQNQNVCLADTSDTDFAKCPSGCRLILLSKQTCLTLEDNLLCQQIINPL